VAEISPVDHAYNEVEQKTRELDSLHLRYSALAKTAQIFSTNTLSMTLNGAVDPPADTIPAYRETFFTPTYLARHADREEQVDRLRTAIDDHVRVVDSCLKLHGQICPPEMLRFHQTLEDLFRKSFPEEIGRIDAQGGFEEVPLQLYARVNDASESSVLFEDASAHRSLSSRSGQSAALALGSSVGVPSTQPSSPLISNVDVATTGMTQTQTTGTAGAMPVKRTPLQMHAAHVARHGINGVSAGWRQDGVGGSEVATMASPRHSLITVGNAPSVNGPAGGSIVASTVGSIKGRFSRFGSLKSGRRG